MDRRAAVTECRFDVIYEGDQVHIQPHFCREWDGDVGCYGTNANHGYTFDEVKESIAQHYEDTAKYWRDLTPEEWERNYG
jgi:hypothetical protein